VRRGSVRLRAAAGATAVVTVALVLVGVAVVFTLRAGLADNTRLRAESAAREVAAQVTDVKAGDVRTVDGLDVEEPVQIVDGRGRVLGSSVDGGPFAGFYPSAEQPEAPEPTRTPGEGDDDDDDPDEGDGDDDGGSPAATPDPVEVDRNSESEVLGLPVDEDGEFARGEEATGRQDFQVVAVHAVTRDGTPVSVYAGASLAGQEEAASSVTRAMLIGLPAVLAVVGGVTWLVVRRALGPVEGIRRGMADITASADLSRRVPEPDARDEIAALARTTNETLEALEQSVERQRRFVADASHELRRPIASLRTQLEVGSHHPELLDLDGAVHDTVRLQTLAADLLLLARLDAGERPGGGRVDLTAVVREELDRREATIPVRLHLEEGEDTSVTGSRSQLGRVVGNLLDNAQRHAVQGVRVSVRPGVVEVADDGAGVPESDRQHIFERFVRLDDARARDDGGAGLGLAIASDVATRHGGTLTVSEAPEGGALFTLRLPRVDRGVRQRS
jgi:signal transduction histidine kinase